MRIINLFHFIFLITLTSQLVAQGPTTNAGISGNLSNADKTGYIFNFGNTYYDDSQIDFSIANWFQSGSTIPNTFGNTNVSFSGDANFTPNHCESPENQGAVVFNITADDANTYSWVSTRFGFKNGDVGHLQDNTLIDFTNHNRLRAMVYVDPSTSNSLTENAETNLIIAAAVIKDQLWEIAVSNEECNYITIQPRTWTVVEFGIDDTNTPIDEGIGFSFRLLNNTTAEEDLAFDGDIYFEWIEFGAMVGTKSSCENTISINCKIDTATPEPSPNPDPDPEPDPDPNPWPDNTNMTNSEITGNAPNESNTGYVFNFGNVLYEYEEIAFDIANWLDDGSDLANTFGNANVMVTADRNQTPNNCESPEDQGSVVYTIVGDDVDNTYNWISTRFGFNNGDIAVGENVIDFTNHRRIRALVLVEPTASNLMDTDAETNLLISAAVDDNGWNLTTSAEECNYITIQPNTWTVVEFDIDNTNYDISKGIGFSFQIINNSSDSTLHTFDGNVYFEWIEFGASVGTKNSCGAPLTTNCKIVTSTPEANTRPNYGDISYVEISGNQPNESKTGYTYNFGNSFICETDTIDFRAVNWLDSTSNIFNTFGTDGVSISGDINATTGYGGDLYSDIGSAISIHDGTINDAHEWTAVRFGYDNGYVAGDPGYENHFIDFSNSENRTIRAVIFVETSPDNPTGLIQDVYILISAAVEDNGWKLLTNESDTEYVNVTPGVWSEIYFTMVPGSYDLTKGVGFSYKIVNTDNDPLSQKFIGKIYFEWIEFGAMAGYKSGLCCYDDYPSWYPEYSVNEPCETSLSEEGNEFEFKAFPNPASTWINFSSTTDGVVKLSNSLGVTISETTDNKIKVEDLSPGVYFATLEVDGHPVAVERIQVY